VGLYSNVAKQRMIVFAYHCKYEQSQRL